MTLGQTFEKQLFYLKNIAKFSIGNSFTATECACIEVSRTGSIKCWSSKDQVASSCDPPEKNDTLRK